jgi:hypothetical protein
MRATQSLSLGIAGAAAMLAGLAPDQAASDWCKQIANGIYCAEPETRRRISAERSPFRSPSRTVSPPILGAR